MLPLEPQILGHISRSRRALGMIMKCLGHQPPALVITPEPGCRRLPSSVELRIPRIHPIKNISTYVCYALFDSYGPIYFIKVLINVANPL